MLPPASLGQEDGDVHIEGIGSLKEMEQTLT